MPTTKLGEFEAELIVLEEGRRVPKVVRGDRTGLEVAGVQVLSHDARARGEIVGHPSRLVLQRIEDERVVFEAEVSEREGRELLAVLGLASARPATARRTWNPKARLRIGSQVIGALAMFGGFVAKIVRGHGHVSGVIVVGIVALGLVAAFPLSWPVNCLFGADGVTVQRPRERRFVSWADVSDVIARPIPGRLDEWSTDVILHDGRRVEGVAVGPEEDARAVEAELAERLAVFRSAFGERGVASAA